MEEISSAQRHSEEVVKAQTITAEVIEKARAAQLEEAVKANREETLEIFTHAMREVLTQGDEGTKALLIQKIPLLCRDLLIIKEDIRDMKNDSRWIKWIGMGFVTACGALALKALGV